MHKLRTIDIWDTLLRRTCHPEAVKLATAQHIFLRFRQNLTDGYSDHWRLYDERLNVERAMAEAAKAAGDDEEYELVGVVLRWLMRVLKLPWPERLEEAAQEIAEYELAFEMDNTFPDEGIAAFAASHPAEKTLYLSDFYMTGTMLDRLLAKHGLQALAPSGLVSCDVMRNKRSGHLFSYVQEMHGVAPHEHVHIGDNPYADVETPRRLGIDAISYLPGVSHAARVEREMLFGSREGLFRMLQDKALEAAEAVIPTHSPEAATMFRLGLQAAPLFVGFILFVAERAIVDKLDRLYFLTREGEFFFRLFQTLFPDGRLAGHSLPTAALFAASRHATFAASLQAVSVLELNRIWNLNWQQKLSTLFAILGVDLAPFSGLLDHLGLSPAETIVRPQDDPRINALLDDPSFAAAVLSSVQEKRAILASYFNQQGIQPKARVGFVDIGWRGSIQDNLAFLLPECETVGYYLALRAFLNPQPENTVKWAFGPDERFEDVATFFEAFEPLELLCNSPFGSVSGYSREGDDTIVPVRKVSELENVSINRFTRHFQDGVIFAVSVQRALLMNHAVMSSEIRRLALHVWQELAAKPPRELLQAYYIAPQHDTFGIGGFFDRGEPPSLGTLLLAPFDRVRRRVTIQYIRRTQWMPALAALKIGPIHRLMLTSAFWLAHRYKASVILRRSKHQRRLRK
jgi:FMN phosphatase YigB (HAD superfamily)